MYKLSVCLSFFLLALVKLHAQDGCLDKIAKQAVEISKLSDSLKQTKDILAAKQLVLQTLRKDSTLNSIKLKDCDSGLIKFNLLKGEQVACLQNLAELKTKIDSMVKELLRVNNNITALEKSKEKLENDNLELNNSGKRLNKIISDRYQVSFDLLIRTSTLESVETDIMIMESLKVDNKLAEKLNKLKLYKESEKLISEKFNEGKIEDARNSMSVFNKEKPIADLINLLTNYKEKNEAIKQMINDLQRKNDEKSKVTALIVEKKQQSMYLVENYLSLYSIDLKRYNYLNQIVSELKNRKLQNADADLADFLQRL